MAEYKVSWIDKLRYYDILEQSGRQKSAEIRKLKKQLEQYQITELAYKLAVNRSGMPAICADFWKNGEAFVVLRLDYGLGDDMHFTFELHRCLKYKTERVGLLYANVDGAGLRIDDLQVTPSQGHGTMLMETLIKFATDKSLSFIKGSLSPFDISDHGERLMKFYEKHQFAITGHKIYRELK